MEKRKTKQSNRDENREGRNTNRRSISGNSKKISRPRRNQYQERTNENESNSRDDNQKEEYRSRRSSVIKRTDSSEGNRRKNIDREEKPFRKRENSSFQNRPTKRPNSGRSHDDENRSEHKTVIKKRNYSERGKEQGLNRQEVPRRNNREKEYVQTEQNGTNSRGFKKRDERRDFDKKNSFQRRENDTYSGEKSFSKKRFSSPDSNDGKQYERKKRILTKNKSSSGEGSTRYDGLIRLNKYISNAGICSRREADVLIQSGVVSVNGKIITEMGYKVSPDDVVNYGGERLVSEKKQYILLNKPKGFITTLDDPEERKTVISLIRNACTERVYPVGRLDRNTTGLLLFTNDGEMTKRLTHPSFGARKIYHVELEEALTHRDLNQLLEGIELEDGFIKVDKAEYVENMGNKNVGIEIHSGKNRIVRRLFENLGYKVLKLDRVMFAGLTKKDLQRGHWRLLTEKEIQFLKMI